MELTAIDKQLENQIEFRKSIQDMESNLLEHENALTGEALDDYNPLKHTFADGCYIREIFSPANQLMVSKIHKKEHPYFLMSGKLSILTEDGVKHLVAPCNGITKPGTKRIIYTHTDCVFITVHATDKLNVYDVEEEVIAKDFKDPAVSLDEINLLKNMI